MKYFLYIFFLILIILFFAYINSKSKEHFIAKINELYYRPIVRNSRLTIEGFYKKMSQHVNNNNRNITIQSRDNYTEELTNQNN